MQCPYCKEDIYPDFEDDVYDGAEHATWCPKCDADIVVTISITIDYATQCKDHDLRVYDMYWHKCTRCGFLDLIDKDNLDSILKAKQYLISKRTVPR